ncbi:hypothetical protein D3C75_1111530 [compost metagenome]
MKQIAIIDYYGGTDYRIVTGYLADRNHAVYAQDGRLYLVRVERVYQTGQNALYIEDQNTAVITLSSDASGHRIAEIIARLQGMTAWDWLTQEALGFHGQQYDFHMI